MLLKPLYDITPFTALDYPDHLAAVFWFAKCNMRCVYCYNKDIVLGEGKITEADALEFLQSRTGLLEAVVLSGGEATLYDDLILFCKKIRQLGFKIKLDTNGLNPAMIQALVENGLVDYIALDYKAPKEKYYAITKNKHFDSFIQSLNFLIKKQFPFEVRTTVHSDLLRVEEINRIIKDLVKRGYRGTYYLQPFLFTEQTLGKVKKEKNLFDTSQLSADLPVVWR
ncbi:anaerobic ribonucleoside-triphosphate reductase activating protein [Sulfurovum riftiae]|uniref:Anaerobic ribonucleoside-triphosphate reductase activating protein n=1 Tax=Sulfurovum riftiae TaxID=1630136 RepID=A0A151CGT2_9BACT|nr:anaerobic ribonucleoside-triphosphate reductase activating protein [Sulfurovum riftiae]KYJ86750.1 anaerobic ribonucleoside-triphosphate reductase activating protein [Sulfurovum riftiae]